MNSKAKNVIGVISDILLIVIMIIAIAITVMTFTSKNSDLQIGNILGYIPFSIQSDSMNTGERSGFARGDLIIGKEVKDVNALKIGDVITYTAVLKDNDGKAIRSFNTHRIVDIIKNNDGSIQSFATQGDAVSMEDNVMVFPDEIIAKQVNSGIEDGLMNKKLNGMKISNFGTAMNFLQSRTGFMVCIIIPLAVFFIWQIYKLIVMFLSTKNEDSDEEIKRKAIEEYIAQQEREKKEAENKEAENKE